MQALHPTNLCLAQHGKMHFRCRTQSHLPHIHIVSICSHSDCSPSLTNLTRLLPLGLIPLSSLSQRVITQRCTISRLPASLTETLWLSLTRKQQGLGQASDHPGNFHTGSVQGDKSPSAHVLGGPMSDVLHRAHASCA